MQDRASVIHPDPLHGPNSDGLGSLGAVFLCRPLVRLLRQAKTKSTARAEFVSSPGGYRTASVVAGTQVQDAPPLLADQFDVDVQLTVPVTPMA